MTEHHQYLLSRCQKYCSYQERSIYEVKMKLIEWQSQPKVADKIINQLVSEDYLNEERFSKSFSIGKFRNKKWGKNKIIYELKKKRIPDLIIQIGLSEINQDEYLQALKELLTKKLAEIKEPNPLKKKYKLATYAVNKGFHSGFVWEIINEELS
jgi:regulatory protein